MFSDDFKSVRHETGLTQAQLAEKTGIPKRTIEQWEGGHREPPEWTQRLVLAELRRLAGKDD